MEKLVRACGRVASEETKDGVEDNNDGPESTAIARGQKAKQCKYCGEYQQRRSTITNIANLPIVNAVMAKS